MTDQLFFDTETRSHVPIAHGTDRYMEGAEPLMATWALNDAPVDFVDLTDEPLPKRLREPLEDPEVEKIAHSASFDRNVCTTLLRTRTAIQSWRCTRAQAYSHGLPGALDTLGHVVGLTAAELKMTEAGANYIPLFCVPFNREPIQYYDRHSHPVEWQNFCDYAVRDTEALRAVYRKLPTHNYQGHRLALYTLDQKINERGFGFDKELALAAVKLLAGAKGKHDADADRLTDGEVQAFTQRKKLLDFLNRKYELDLPNMRAATLREVLDTSDLAPELRFLLESRLEAAMASGAKYKKGLTLLGDGDRIRHGIQFNGAGRTGRFSGKGFQPHNMRRPKAKFAQIKMEIDALKAGNWDLL